MEYCPTVLSEVLQARSTAYPPDAVARIFTQVLDLNLPNILKNLILHYVAIRVKTMPNYDKISQFFTGNGRSFGIAQLKSSNRSSRSQT